MAVLWVPEAKRLTPAGTSGTMSGVGGPRATLHCTVSAPGSFWDMHRVLIGKKAEPHFLYDAKTDTLGQYFPLDRSARALMSGTHSISHNKMGTRNIQVEMCNSTDDWTARGDWNPGPNFRAMMRAIRDHGVEPVQIAPFAQTSGENRRQSWTTFSTNAGGGKWWGHCHVPDGESHWDPGRVNWSRFIAAAAYEGDSMSAADVAELKDYLGKVLVSGYTIGEKSYPGIARVDIENQSRLTKGFADVQLQLAGVSAALEALAKAQGVVDPAEVVAVVDRAVRDRLDRIDFTVSDTPEVPA